MLPSSLDIVHKTVIVPFYLLISGGSVLSTLEAAEDVGAAGLF